MYSVIEEQKVKIFDTDQEAVVRKVLTKIDRRDLVTIDGVLTYVVPDGVEVIGEEVFTMIPAKTVILPNSLKKISNRAFYNCAIESIEIPDSVECIEARAFLSDIHLKHVKLPRNLKVINKQTFHSCMHLKHIDIPPSLEMICTEAFCGSGLTEFVIGKNLTYIGDGAFAQSGISEIVMERADIEVHPDAFQGCKINSLTVEGEKYTLSNLDNKEKHLCKYVNNIEKLKKLEDLSTRLAEHKQHIQHAFAVELVDANMQDEFAEGYFKFYNQLHKLYFKDTKKPGSIAVFQKLCFNLGVFVNDKTIANKSSEFLKQVFVDGKLDESKITGLFHQMQLRGYHPEFTKFFCTKKVFDEMIIITETQEDFIARVFNNFDETQRYNTARNTNHRQLAPTIATFERYFQNGAFDGVTDETRPIANEMAKFSQMKQEDFEQAVKIYYEYKKMLEETGYVDKAIVEEDVFERINYYSKQIEQNLVDTAQMLNELMNKEFTYEWLAKNDPRNFTIGYYCSCCAHIGGAGQGIVRASMVLPYIHNLVVKNKRGDIRVKATMYVNEEQGYAVINNFELFRDYNLMASDSQEKRRSKVDDQAKIYEKLKAGVEKFVEEYNSTHEIPLTIVTVGMDRNDLYHILENNPVPDKILKAINYADYGDKDHAHAGDSEHGQLIFWQSQKEDVWAR